MTQLKTYLLLELILQLSVYNLCNDSRWTTKRILMPIEVVIKVGWKVSDDVLGVLHVFLWMD